MMSPITMRCPECRARFSLAQPLPPGRQLPCPECAALIAPQPEEDEPRTDGWRGTSTDDRGRPSRQPGRRDDGDVVDRPARRPSRGSSSGFALGCGVLAVLLVGCVLALWLWPSGSFLPEQKEDYAQARARFQTRLLVFGPSPQLGQRERVAHGAGEVPYMSGQLKLRAWISDPPPPGPPRRPAVLFLHDGMAFGAEDWEQSRPYRDAGFVVMMPMLRGENGLPGHYSMFYDEVDDVLAAADFLAARPEVDPTHLYVAGHIEGGTLAMLAAMASPKFRAAASFSGSTDQRAWVKVQQQMPVFDPSDEKEFLLRSPLAYAGSFKCPARLYYARDDRFFRANTEELARRAQAAGLDVEAVRVPGDLLTMVDPAIRLSIKFFLNGVPGR